MGPLWLTERSPACLSNYFKSNCLAFQDSLALCSIPGYLWPLRPRSQGLPHYLGVDGQHDPGLWESSSEQGLTGSKWVFATPRKEGQPWPSQGKPFPRLSREVR